MSPDTPPPDTAQPTGSAARWGPLWGARPDDWAYSEEQQVPTYEAALNRVQLDPGQLVLDIGCGAGVFLGLVAERGAKPFGLDASEALIAAARARVPNADLSVGDMEAVLALKPEVVVIGSGPRQQFPAPEILGALLSRGVGCEVMDTGAACRTYNVLASEGRTVVAALLLRNND